MHNWQVHENSIIISTNDGMIKIQPVNSCIFRIVYTKKVEFSTKESLFIDVSPETDVNWEIFEEDTIIKIVTEKLQLIISKETVSFSWYDLSGKLLVKEPDSGGKHIEEVDVIKTKFDSATRYREIKSVDGIRTVAENVQNYVDRKAYNTKLEFEWQVEEAIYGLGQHEDGILNYRGKTQYLYQANMKIAIPAIVSTNGYGVLLDSASYAIFNDNKSGSYIWTEIDDEMDYYFIYGPEIDDVVSGIRFLTGEAVMMPRWAFGFIQSREHYKNSDELLEIVRRHREDNIPIDCIVQDWKSWHQGWWGNKEFDESRFPNPDEMVRQLHSMNTKLMISIWPNMNAGCPNHTEMKENNFLLGDGLTYDAFNQDARELYWSQAQKGLFNHGVDAWWCDSTEPFTSTDWAGEKRLEGNVRADKIKEEFYKYLDPETINAYSLMHSKGIYEGQRNANDKKRVVNLTRSAYAGQQKYGTITWAGDTSAKWEVLRKHIADGLNFCITGLPYWTVDIGAFFAGGYSCWKKWSNDQNVDKVWFWDGDYDTGNEDYGYRELYTRWFQYGVFLPIFRSHGTDTERELWYFGNPGDVFYDILYQYNLLRYRLIPYIYSLAGQVFLNDYTILRSLAFDFRHDTMVFDINDQYMFGPSIMVCPVTRPMYYTKNSAKIDVLEKTREVYLPEGSCWYDYWTGKHYNGGQRIDADAPLDIIPLFIKSGSILIIGAQIYYADESSEKPLEIRIYTGANSYFEIYDDEGNNYNYEKGMYSITPLTWDDTSHTLTFGEQTGDFPGRKKEQKYKIVIISENFSMLSSEEMEDCIYLTYNGEYRDVDLSLLTNRADS